MSEDAKAFIEDMARALESTGTPWVAGAIVGYLAIAPAGEASQAELAEELGSSVAAISAMVRRLTTEGTLQRVVVPGQRSAHYRLVPGSYLARLDAAIAASQELVDLAQRGLVLSGTVGPGRSFLQEFRDLNKALGAKFTELRSSYSDGNRKARRG